MAFPHYPRKKTPFQPNIHGKLVVRLWIPQIQIICCTYKIPVHGHEWMLRSELDRASRGHGWCPQTWWVTAFSPWNLRAAADTPGLCLCSAPFTVQVWADNGLDFPFTAAFILSVLRYHQRQGKCWEISLTVLSDIWLQKALAYPTPLLADYFKGTDSPFSSAAWTVSFPGLCFWPFFFFSPTKCISAIACPGLDLKRNLSFWTDNPKLGDKVMEFEVLWTFWMIFVCSQGSKISSSSWTFPFLLLLSFETRVFFQERFVPLKEYFPN